MQSRELPTCACCGAGEWQRHSYTSTASYLECLRCHYYTQITASASDRAAQFEAEQRKFFDEDSLFFSSTHSAVNAEMTRRRASVVQRFLSPGASVLEVGPGSGDLILMLAERGYAATAVEHSNALATHLREKGRFSVIVGDFADLRLPRASYDAYCSFHVIEHVIDFRKHLAVARDCVRPGGYAIVATPNSRGWEHRLPFALSPNYDSSHFQLFSDKALTSVLRETGWEPVSVITPAYSIAWIRVITKILRRLRRQDEDATGGHYAKSVGKRTRLAISAFSAITYPFRRLQEFLAGGNELLVIARRSQ